MGGHGKQTRLTFSPPAVKPAHRWLAVGFGAMTWFWIMYRMKQDGAVMLGLRDAPWVEDVRAENAAASKRIEGHHD